MPAMLEVIGVSKSYPGLPVLKEASFAAHQAEIVCLLGPSGGGKTTLLRIVAGLEQPDTGRVLLEGRDLAGIPVHRRNFGFMFQDYALFPHRNVAENVAFGLRMQGMPPQEITQRVRESLALVALSGYERRRVLDLSGGEQQRVALARSLAPRPRLLMLDEPLGSLDRSLREQLMNELREILKRVGLTVLYVTHDQSEAFAVADRVLIMRANPEGGEGGWIEQDGAPAHVYRYPATPYVARFLGFKNLIDATVSARSKSARSESARSEWAPQGNYLVADTPFGPLVVGDVNAVTPKDGHVKLLIRPEATDVRAADAVGENVIDGRLIEASFRGSYYLLRTAHAEGIELVTEASATDSEIPESGGPLRLWLDPMAITLLPR